MRTMDDAVLHEIAAAAASSVVEDGLDYGAAKRRAVDALGLPIRTPLPSNEQVEMAVREHLRLFHADTQPQELRALRRLALPWMQRLAPFRPHLSGAVWRGTATRQNDIRLELFCDDPKSAEIWLLDQNLRYDVSTVTGFQGESIDALSLSVPSSELAQAVWVHLLIHDHDALRGALRPDAQGLTWRGDWTALMRLMNEEDDT